MSIMTVLMVLQGVNLSPDRYAFVLILGSLLVKKTRNFIFDWIPFLLILISWDYLRELVGTLSQSADYLVSINFDTELFQTLPNITLQQYFFNPNNLQWYDFLATLLYLLHLILPISFGFLVWISNKKVIFKEFVTAFSLLSYGAWATFLLFPAAPPWLAAQEGYISGVAKVMDHTLKLFSTQVDLVSTYHNLHPNPVGAIPSTHTAFPLLIFLFALKAFKTKALIFLPYVLAVWISIVYLGEHYVLDILIGIIYTIVFYLLSVKLMHRINWSLLLQQKKVRFLSNKPTTVKIDDQTL